EQDLGVQPAIAAAAVADAADSVGDIDAIPEPLTEELAEAELEPEEQTDDLEGSELIDDPVRMYLREIGRVTLLTAADERRLAQQLASGKHVEKLEKDLSAELGRPAR